MVSVIRPFAKRKYEKIPVDRIQVLNSRNRERGEFQANIRSIKNVGLLKPIVVNERNFKKNNYYELVCGEGRFLAYKELNKKEIPAEVINCTKKNALLYSLVENIARMTPGTMWFAREIKRMHDAGMTFAQISNITGKNENYLKAYLPLVERGEERLIRGVEKGLFPIGFAMKVAKADGSQVQNILMDAFDSGVINSSNFTTIKKIIATRINTVKKGVSGDDGIRSRSLDYSMTQLKADISKLTKEKEAFVNEASLKENRLLTLLDGLNSLWPDSRFIKLITAEDLQERPEMKGNYHV